MEVEYHITNEEIQKVHHAACEIEKVIKRLMFEEKVKPYLVASMLHQELYNLYRTAEEKKL